MIAQLEFEKEQELPSLVCVEPAHIPIEVILSARAHLLVSNRAPITLFM